MPNTTIQQMLFFSFFLANTLSVSSDYMEFQFTAYLLYRGVQDLLLF